MSAPSVESHRKHRARQYDAGQALIESYLEECADCGNDDIRVLEFDHVFGPPLQVNGKRTTIASLTSNRPALIREIEKCEVRCANCHKLRHAEEEAYAKSA